MKVFGIGGLILLIVVLITIGPFITIWALNTLFGLGIAFNFFTWAAVVWLTGVLSAVSSSSVRG